ncbi:MAG: hypothetical protein A3E81_08685 [Gammaproteobacteria bacterium RIFCSPHIGHO2_12_FULL_36_30]|nr:MAG: hypothetical protein A3E81_08685 [Gammaproteobacteria bacterium RIFCSPHIGHO2_12_FULL_36_30]
MKKMSKAVILFCGVMGLASFAYAKIPIPLTCPQVSQIRYINGHYVTTNGWGQVGSVQNQRLEGLTFSEAMMSLSQNGPGSFGPGAVTCSYSGTASNGQAYMALNPGVRPPNYQPSSQNDVYLPFGSNWSKPDSYGTVKCTSSLDSCLFGKANG